MTTAPRTRTPALTGQRLGLVTILLAILAFGLWMWLAPLHSAVVTTGQVKTAINRTFVQHTEGGIVSEILVRNGDSVQAGQPLVVLDNVRADANKDLLRELALLETVKLQRLDAEQQLAPTFSLSEELQAADPKTLETAYQRELKIFNTRRGLLDEQLASYQRQLSAINQEQQGLIRQKEASAEAVQLARDELGINSALEDGQYISRARLLSLKRIVAELGARQGEHEAMLAKSQQREDELVLRMASARSEYQRIAAEEYKESYRRSVELREQLRPAEEEGRRKTILAPVSGKVVGLRLNTPGEVAPPLEPLMEIVPDNQPLLVEAQVGVDSIRHLHLGQPTELRFTTFNARTVPLVQGELTYISADALPGKDEVPHFTIQVEPQAEALHAAGIPAIKPGMAAEVYVLIESRSTFDYLLAPITDILRRSLREP